MILTTKQLADELQISVSRINELGRKGKLPPREPDGRWDLAKVRASLEGNMDAYQASPARGDPPPASRGMGPGMGAAQFPQPQRSPERGTMAYAQLQHELAKATKAALEAQRMENRLVDRAAVELEWTSVCAAIRSAVLALPARIVNRLPAEYRRIVLPVVEEECRATLRALSDEVRNDSKAA
jgi:hypothetical protein